MKLLLFNFLLLLMFVYTNGFIEFLKLRPIPPVTKLSFHTTFKCSLDTNYCVFGHYLEENNSPFPDVKLSEIHFYCRNENPEGQKDLLNHASIKLEGDDGYFDTYYDPSIQIFHNCSTTGSVMEYKVFLEDVWVYAPSNVQRPIIELTDEGRIQRGRIEDIVKANIPEVDHRRLTTKEIKEINNRRSYFHDENLVKIPIWSR